MTIIITGNEGEILYSIVADGEKCFITEQDKHEIKTRQAKIYIKEDKRPIVKAKIIETTEKYDKDGKLVEKITREETSEDNNDCVMSYPNKSFGGTAVYTNPPYYSYCGTRCESQPSIGIGHESHA